MPQRTVSQETRSAREALLGQKGNEKAFVRYNKMDEETKLNLLSLSRSDFIERIKRYNGPAAVRPTVETHRRSIGAVYAACTMPSGITK